MPRKKRTRTTRASARRATPRRRKKPGPIPDVIFAQASPRSQGGVSLFEAGVQINCATVVNFASDPDLIRRSAAALQDAGFTILQISPQTINIAGSRRLYEHAFNASIVAEEREVIKPEGPSTATFLESPQTELPGLISTENSGFAELLEGVALEEPRYFMAASMFPPLKTYWHLDVPAGVSLGCNADKAHRGGITGRGIRVAMVDSGHFKHPFFKARGYRVAPVTLGPAASNPLADDVGHGTGESANIFAVAPDVELLPVKVNFVNTISAFNTAVGLNPDIISCSWGSNKQHGPLSAADQALAASVAAAIVDGIIVVFAAGNGHWGFPGQHPDVISAGGVYMKPDGALMASDHASGFKSNIYPNRSVPDLCGLVGLRPKSIYIMLPLEPRDDIDAHNAGGVYPDGDETGRSDGWAGFSGTSAAAPQLAGAAALVKQACPELNPTEVRDLLKRGARDVKTGTGALGQAAAAGPDLATGAGLVDAHKSVILAKVQCLGPVRASQPGPMVAVRRAIGLRAGPNVMRPSVTAAATEPAAMTPGLSAEDVAALQQMIAESDLEM